jgi:hypothetical protein
MVFLYCHPESLAFRIRSQSFGSQLIRAKSQQHIGAMATSLQSAMILPVDSESMLRMDLMLASVRHANESSNSRNTAKPIR